MKKAEEPPRSFALEALLPEASAARGDLDDATRLESVGAATSTRWCPRRRTWRRTTTSSTTRCACAGWASTRRRSGRGETGIARRYARLDASQAREAWTKELATILARCRACAGGARWRCSSRTPRCRTRRCARTRSSGRWRRRQGSRCWRGRRRPGRTSTGRRRGVRARAEGRARDRAREAVALAPDTRSERLRVPCGEPISDLRSTSPVSPTDRGLAGTMARRVTAMASAGGRDGPAGHRELIGRSSQWPGKAAPSRPPGPVRSSGRSEGSAVAGHRDGWPASTRRVGGHVDGPDGSARDVGRLDATARAGGREAPGRSSRWPGR